MMHKAWCGIGEVPNCFSRSSVKFQGHRAQKIIDFDPNWAFPDCNSSLNSRMVIKWCAKLAKKRCPIVFWGHLSIFKVTQDKTIINFDPNWAFPDCNYSLNSPMTLKWYTKFGVIQKRCRIVFQGHPSNYEVIRAEKLTIWIQFE